MTTNVNLYVDQNTDFTAEISVFDSASSDYTIDDQTFTASAKKMYSASPAFSIVVTVDTEDGDVNNLTLSISANTTVDLDPGKYRYNVLMDDGTEKIKILEGLLILLPTV